MKVLISAGGKGTRIQAAFPDIPKPLIPVCGKPVIEHQLECLRRFGLTDIVILTCHLAEYIESYFGDGSRFGVKISYFRETSPLGTAGALFKLRDRLTEDFLLINGDIIYDLDFDRLLKYHAERGGEATLVTHPNTHPFDSGLLIAGPDGRLDRWLTKEDPRTFYKNRVNAGVHILSPRLLDRAARRLPDGQEKIDLDREVLKPLIGFSPIYVYDTSEYIFDMGTPERFARVEQDMKNGLIQARNLSRPQRAVFFDRDGTLNKLNGFVSSPEQLELTPDAAETVRMVNESGRLAIVISNQPVVARGECTFEQLDEINRKLETLLGEQGAYLNDIFCCPHHPDKGFPGERPELKIVCDCRKPKPGLFLEAAKKHHIDLANSVMIGDSDIDVLAGHSAGCRSFKITEGKMMETVRKALES